MQNTVEHVKEIPLLYKLERYVEQFTCLDHATNNAMNKNMPDL